MAGFRFKQFEIQQDRCAMKVGTDGVLLGAWAEGGRRILDIGSGTGLISLMMAQRFPEAQVLGIDIDPDACEQARENISNSPFSERVSIECCALQKLSENIVSASFSSAAKNEEKRLLCDEEGLQNNDFSHDKECLFDAIVSNPPFFVNSMKNPDSKRTLARHSDSLPFAELMKGVKRWLSEDGLFSAIVPVDVLEQFVAEAYCSGLSLVKKCGVKTVERKMPKRYLLTFAKKRKEALQEEVVVMTDNNGNRSPWYAKITEEFYLDKA